MALSGRTRRADVHLDAGTHMIHVDPVKGLAAGVRWIETARMPEFVAKLPAAVRR